MVFAPLKTNSDGLKDKTRINLALIDRYEPWNPKTDTALYMQGEDDASQPTVVHCPIAELRDLIREAGLADEFVTLTRYGGEVGVNIDRITSYFPLKEGTQIEQPNGTFEVTETADHIDKLLGPRRVHGPRPAIERIAAP